MGISSSPEQFEIHTFTMKLLIVASLITVAFAADYPGYSKPAYPLPAFPQSTEYPSAPKPKPTYPAPVAYPSEAKPSINNYPAATVSCD